MHAGCLLNVDANAARANTLGRRDIEAAQRDVDAGPVDDKTRVSSDETTCPVNGSSDPLAID
jgi:hypothetical protein